MLCNPKVHLRARKIAFLRHVLIQRNPDHILTLYFFNESPQYYLFFYLFNFPTGILLSEFLITM
jgi:hypothetical protein